MNFPASELAQGICDRKEAAELRPGVGSLQAQDVRGQVIEALNFSSVALG
jgi:hypothetical protein